MKQDKSRSAVMSSKIIKNYLHTTCQHIYLDFDIDAHECFAELKDFILSNDASHLCTFSLLELSTIGLSEDDYSSFHNIAKLTSLEVCILKGGRKGKNGQSMHGGLQTLPAEFGKLKLLTQVDLSFNKIQIFPECLSNLHRLKILKLDFNELTTINSNISAMEHLEVLSVRRNKLASITHEIHQLQKLKVLNVASNLLQELPESLFYLPSLVELDISTNQFSTLPKSLLFSQTIQRVICTHNSLEHLPDEAEFLTLSCLDVRFNYIVEVSNAVRDNGRILLQGNIPKHPAQKSFLDCQVVDEYDVPNCNLSSDICTLLVDPSCGTRYELPSSIAVTFPKKCTDEIMEFYCNVVAIGTSDFKLRPTDQLLSAVLEMRPNGVVFRKRVRIQLPYTYAGFDHQRRQIVMRVTFQSQDGAYAFEDLDSELEPPTKSGCWKAIGYTDHFSMFAVVARLVEDTVTLDKVLSVDPGVVSKVTKTAESYASDVLHVHVSPSDTAFHLPVTVHLALPEQLMGKTFNHHELRLLKCANDSSEWNDVTDLVEMVFSTVDVSFQVQSFSKFWLVWNNVCGVAKLVYRRLITYQVQFLAMQKAMVPTVVIAQCVRASLTEKRIIQLKKEGYSGDDSYTEVQELLEGDQFKIKVLGELQTKTYGDADKEHLENQVLVRRFHSQYPPEKSGFSRFCIEPASGVESRSPTGYVAFYRILPRFDFVSSDDVKQRANLQLGDRRSSAIKRGLRNESDESSCGDNVKNRASSKSNFDEETVPLGNVLIVLKKDNSPVKLAESIEHELNFGELGTGMFNEANLRYFASLIGAEWQQLGSFLGLSTACMERLQEAHPRQPSEYIYRMLRKWAIMHSHEDDCVESFVEALQDADRTDVAHKVMRIYREGKEKFNSTLKKRRELSEIQKVDA